MPSFVSIAPTSRSTQSLAPPSHDLEDGPRLPYYDKQTGSFYPLDFYSQLTLALRTQNTADCSGICINTHYLKVTRSKGNTYFSFVPRNSSSNPDSLRPHQAKKRKATPTQQNVKFQKLITKTAL